MHLASAPTRSANAVVPSPSTTGNSQASPWPRRIIWSIAVAAFLAGLTILFYYFSVRTVVPDSDTATAVLQGQSMASGQLTLHGWDLSVDSFWSVDAVFYAIGVLLVGVRSVFLHLVPAFVASLIALFGILLAREGRKAAASIAAGLAVFAIIGLPNSYFCYFFLKGVAHVGTTLWCLIAFFVLCRWPNRWGWIVGVVFLAAGLLGDLQMIALGFAPVLAAGLVAMLRTRSFKGGLPMAGAAVASVALAGTVKGLALLIGTFSIGKIQASAVPSQTIVNIKHLVPDTRHMLGIVSYQGAMRAPLAVHVLGGVLLALGFIFFGVKLAVGSITGNAKGSVDRGGASVDRREAWRIDDLLVCAYICGLIAFVKLATSNDFNYERYLTAAIIYGAILAGRFAGELVSHVRSKALLATGAVIGAASLAGLGVSTQSLLAQPVLGQPQQELGHFLESQGLHKGIGDYWSASITTVVTDGAVTVRPVISGRNGILVRYARQSSEGWYRGQSFQFVVYDTASLFGVDTASATKTFGRPSSTYVIGSYVVLVFPNGLSVNPTGGYDAG